MQNRDLDRQVELVWTWQRATQQCVRVVPGCAKSFAERTCAQTVQVCNDMAKKEQPACS